MIPFDANGIFAPYVPSGGSALRRLAVRSAGIAIVSGGAVLAIQIVSTVVLARLLTPRDYGLITMVTTFSILLESFGTNGIVDAVVQAQEINRQQASNLFWTYFGGGISLMLLFLAAGPLIAHLFRDSAITLIAAGISLTILFSSLSGLHLGLLKRAMRFQDVAVNNISARILSVGVAILLAWAGWHYWALVAGACVLSIATAIGSWIQCQWLPSPPRNLASIRQSLRFAIYAYARFALNYFARNTDNLLVGWRFGSPVLGSYKKAYDLFLLPSTQLVTTTYSVAVSALSRVREDHEQFNRLLLGAISVMALLGMGIAGDMALVGKDLVRVVLGPGWDSAGEIFTIFAPGIGIMMVYWVHGWIHLAVGRSDRWFRWGIVEWGVTISLFLACLQWGPEGVALAWCTSFWILTIPAIWYAGRPIDLSPAPVVAAVWRYIVASIFAGAASRSALSCFTVLATWEGATGAALRVLSVSLLFSALYLSFVLLLFGGPAPLRRVLSLYRELRQPVREPAVITS